MYVIGIWHKRRDCARRQQHETARQQFDPLVRVCIRGVVDTYERLFLQHAFHDTDHAPGAVVVDGGPLAGAQTIVNRESESSCPAKIRLRA